jgi:hypothetical protein
MRGAIAALAVSPLLTVRLPPLQIWKGLSPSKPPLKRDS